MLCEERPWGNRVNGLGFISARTYILPFLSWEYKNGKEKKIKRNNAEIFFEAANEMCRFTQRYREVPVKALPKKEASEIKHLFAEIKDEDGDKRHMAWIDALKRSNFSFGTANISYDDRGNNSWKAKALGTAYDLPVHTYKDEFLDSDWKMFHDALQQHRLTLLHTILPKYCICAA